MNAGRRETGSCFAPLQMKKGLLGRRRKLQDASNAGVEIVRAPDLLEMRERGLARAMARRELLHMPGIVERGGDLRDLFIGRRRHVEPAHDQMHSWMDASSGFD